MNKYGTNIMVQHCSCLLSIEHVASTLRSIRQLPVTYINLAQFHVVETMFLFTRSSDRDVMYIWLQ